MEIEKRINELEYALRKQYIGDNLSFLNRYGFVKFTKIVDITEKGYVTKVSSVAPEVTVPFEAIDTAYFFSTRRLRDRDWKGDGVRNTYCYVQQKKQWERVVQKAKTKTEKEIVVLCEERHCQDKNIYDKILEDPQKANAIISAYWSAMIDINH